MAPGTVVMAPGAVVMAVGNGYCHSFFWYNTTYSYKLKTTRKKLVFHLVEYNMGGAREGGQGKIVCLPTLIWLA